MWFIIFSFRVSAFTSFPQCLFVVYSTCAEFLLLFFSHFLEGKRKGRRKFIFLTARLLPVEFILRLVCCPLNSFLRLLDTEFIFLSDDS